METAPKYSIIIPIYKAEATLRRCVDSILDQHYPDMELILVNDGSPDRSGDICEDYAARFGCVVCIHKPNGGVSSARNAGLDRASGKYVLFVDSDDYVADRYFSALDAMCAESEYDFVMFSYHITDGKQISSSIFSGFSSFTPEESVSKFCEALYTKTLNPPVTKLYTRQIIESSHLRFPEQLSIGEDKSFNLMYVMHCQSCLISPEPLYFVSTENADSLSRGVRPDLYRQFELLDALTQQTIRNADIPESFRRQFIAAENLIQLRTVYSESKRMHLAKCERRFRRQKIRRMCRELNGRNQSYPAGTFSVLLQIPVRLRLITLIDLMGWKLAR